MWLLPDLMILTWFGICSPERFPPTVLTLTLTLCVVVTVISVPLMPKLFVTFSRIPLFVLDLLVYRLRRPNLTPKLITCILSVYRSVLGRLMLMAIKCLVADVVLNIWLILLAFRPIMVAPVRLKTSSPSLKQLLNAGRLTGETRLCLTPRKYVMLNGRPLMCRHPSVRSEILTITDR